MKTCFNLNAAENYRSKSQIARVLTENWVLENMFCPRCGNIHINAFSNNKPVADFYCPNCKNQFELKSKSGSFAHKINDGAYATMIARITSNKNPDFFLMNYSRAENRVNDFVMVPKHFFVPEIIEKRKPLADTARRAGWVGCNIIIDKIPEQGKIQIISGGVLQDKKTVLEKVRKSDLLIEKNISARTWLMDILSIVNYIENEHFSLGEIYAFESILSQKHPDNHNILPKIRQQLQILRDKGFIEFLGGGKYRKII